MLADALQALTTWVGAIVTWGGLAGITLIALLENLFPPTPSEWLYPLAGKMAYDGKVNLLGVMLAGVLGSLIGATVWYTIGYRLGEARARELIARHGRVRLWRWGITLFKVEDYDNGLRLFRERGGVVVFVARLMPVVHGVVSVPAGVARMSLVPFYFFTTLGSFFWIAPLTLFGYFLGSQWERILEWLDLYQVVWFALIALAVAYYAVRRVVIYRREKAQGMV
jgi:membrane protein DedA with SNARE-associated domain